LDQAFRTEGFSVQEFVHPSCVFVAGGGAEGFPSLFAPQTNVIEVAHNDDITLATPLTIHADQLKKSIGDANPPGLIAPDGTGMSSVKQQGLTSPGGKPGTPSQILSKTVPILPQTQTKTAVWFEIRHQRKIRFAVVPLVAQGEGELDPALRVQKGRVFA
jgi:hypothetical protein